MQTQLIDDSFTQDNNFSSNIHPIEKIVLLNNNIDDDYIIPTKYNKSKVVLLPVNRQKYYVYWEIEDNILLEHNLSSCNDLVFKIKNSNNEILFSASLNDSVGEYFIKEQFDDKYIKVVIGFEQNGVFIEILHSRLIKTFNTAIKYTKENEQTYLQKSKNFTEIIKASMQHFTLGMSSASYVEEMERLHEFSKISQENYSSHKLGELK